jgi:hypothetical protein
VIYHIYCRAKAVREKYTAMFWKNFNPANALEELVETENLCRRIEGEGSAVFLAVERYIATFREAIRLTLLLQNNSMKNRHWDKLVKITRHNFETSIDMNIMRVRDMLGMIEREIGFYQYGSTKALDECDQLR